MHGRRKEEKSDEVIAQKAKERQFKLQKFVAARDMIMHKQNNGIYDPEGLAVTWKLLSNNPDIYTLWNYRRKSILGLINVQQQKEGENIECCQLIDGEKLFQTELELSELCIREQPKSYSAWHQRSWVLKQMNKPDYKAELKLCDQALSLDERNFHCWDHRRLVCKLANIEPEVELQFAVSKINDNFSNYSAWHYKSSILPQVHPDPHQNLPICLDKLVIELELATNAFYTDPEDESAWMYTNWLFSKGVCSRREKACLIFAEICFEFGVGVILFSNAVCLTSSFITCSIGGIDVQLNWQPNAQNAKYAHVWVCNIENEVQCGSLEVKLKSKDESLASCEILAPFVKQENRATFVSEDFDKFIREQSGFGLQLSESLKLALNKMMESCAELVAEEPQNKWPLLIYTLSMMRIDPMLHQRQILDNFDKLKLLDPKRRQYYVHSSDKFTISRAIFTQIKDGCLELNLKDCGLSNLSYNPILSIIKAIDLSVNEFDNKVNFDPFICLRGLKIGQIYSKGDKVRNEIFLGLDKLEARKCVIEYS